MEAAGHRLAELTGAEWGIVTCGSATAVALGTAACVAGNDPVKMLRLPFTDGMVNRVIIPKTQRFAYDQAVRMIGCHLVEIETREDLDQALAEPVAMVVLLGKQEHLGSLRLGFVLRSVDLFELLQGAQIGGVWLPGVNLRHAVQETSPT